jgi:hypothetical protein
VLGAVQDFRRAGHGSLERNYFFGPNLMSDIDGLRKSH